MYFFITTEAGTAKANVVVRVRRSIVEVQGEGPGIRTIVPIATADEPAHQLFLISSPYLKIDS